MELRHIRYFLVVAEEKNFTRAAKRLDISQPPLSMQIKNLEDEIGVELFYRSAHGAQLTPAGQAFLGAVQPIQQRLGDAVALAQRVANGEVGQLRLGFTSTAMLNPILPKSIRLFQQRYPNIQLKLEEGSSLSLIERLRNKKLDIALIRPFQQAPAELHVQILLYEPLVAVVPAQHEFIAGQEIQLKQLKDRPFIVAAHSVSSGLHDAVFAACRSHGLEPMIGQNAPQIVSIVSLVAANLGVSLVPASSMQLGIKGVCYFDIAAPKPVVGLSLIYRQNTDSQPAINFASLIQTLAKD